MPTGIYPRSPELMKQVCKNLAIGRNKKNQAKATTTKRKLAQTPEWRQRVSNGTRKALNEPETRKKYLKGMERSRGYKYDGQPVPLAPDLAASIVIATELINRFWARVRIGGPDKCWPFIPSEDKKDYGSFWIGNGREEPANRIVLILKLSRDLKDHEQALHTCDNPPCCNPNHIFLGTNYDNVQDKMKKGRHKTPRGEDHPMAKLTKKKARRIKQCLSNGESVSDLAKKYEVSEYTIREIKNGRRWND